MKVVIMLLLPFWLLRFKHWMEQSSQFYSSRLILYIKSNNKKWGRNKLSATTKAKNRELIFKALTDPNFRNLLQTQPAKALGATTLTPEKAKMVTNALSAIKEIEAKINSIADELLCANGGPCGIARGDTKTVRMG
jgi:hypothetical protein